MTNTDKLVDYVIQHAHELDPTKITALSQVIKSLGPDVPQEPNEMPADEPDELITDTEPFDLVEIKNLQVDGQPSQPITIHK